MTVQKILLLKYMYFFLFPDGEQEWQNIAKDHEELWQFPNCLEVHGKHVAIIPPKDVGSYYYNYKGFHSLDFACSY